MKKDVADVLSIESITICVHVVQGQSRLGSAEERWSVYGLSESHDAIFSWYWEWTELSSCNTESVTTGEFLRAAVLTLTETVTK